MPIPPEEPQIIPVSISAADLSARLGMSERLIRQKAREFGTCRILGRTMFFLPEDVDALVSLLSGKNAEANRQIKKEIAAERTRRIMLGIDRPNQASYGHIYYIAGEDRVKIGFAKNIKNRLHNLQTASPFPLVLLASHRGSQKKERELHARFAEYRLTGEWFRLDGAVKDHITGLVSK